MESTPFNSRVRSDAGVAIFLLVVLGLGLRTYHYFRQADIWHDEAALVVNVLDKSYTEQLGPLFWAEAAPPAYLWLERLCAIVLGDELWVLRLPSFVASCTALVLFGWVVRSLPVAAAVVATLLMSVSDSQLWHCYEAKPYAIDVLVAVAAMAFHKWSDHKSAATTALGGALVTPILVFLSFPATFILGAAIVARCWRLAAERSAASAAAHALWAVVLVASFLALLLGPIHAQRCGVLEGCWTDMMPDWSRPFQVPAWVVVHVCEAFRYCFPPLGQSLLPFAVIGAVAAWRSEKRDWLAVAAMPAALALVAAMIRRYPFGASRVIVFAAPGWALLIGVGVEAAWRSLPWRRYAIAGLVAPLAAGFGLAIWSLNPAGVRPECHAAAEWLSLRVRPGEAVATNHWEYVYLLRNSGASLWAVEPDHADVSQPPNLSCVSRIEDVRKPKWLIFNTANPRNTNSMDHLAGLVGAQRAATFAGTVVYRLSDRLR